MSWNPLFGQLQIFVQDFPPFSRRLQYLFFGFRKRDNTSKKTWKSPLLDCLSALRNFPFRFPLSFLLAFQLPKQMETMMMTMIKPSIFPIEWTQKIVSRALKLDYVTHAEKLSWLSNFSSILESFMVIYIKLESILKIAQNVVKIRISIIIGTFLNLVTQPLCNYLISTYFCRSIFSCSSSQWIGLDAFSSVWRFNFSRYAISLSNSAQSISCCVDLSSCNCRIHWR